MSGNPNPQHVPTDGLGVAAYVQVSGTGITSPSGGTTVHPGASGTNGQGIGATAGGTFPVAQYALTLSLSSAGGFSNTCQLTTTEVDVKNNAYSPVGSPVYVSYGDPNNAAGSPPAWYKPSAFAGYTAEIVSVSSSGLITSRGVGQAIVEVSFPTFDNTLGNGPSDINEAEPVNFIYVQIIVTVIP
jgi:hypothetical protein